MKKRKDGRLQASITLSDGKRKVFYGQTKTEIQQKILDFREKENMAPLFGKVAKEWYDGFWKTVSPNTMDQYDPAYDRVVELFGDRPIDDIEPADIQALFNDLKAKGYSANYIKAHKIVLNKIFNHEILRKGGRLKYNPVNAARVPRIAKKKIPAATPEQEQTIIDSIDLPFGLFAFFMLYTGCRTQEALALQWADINISGKTISINKAVTWPYNNQAVIKETKTVNGVRVIPLLDPLRIKLYVARMRERAKDDEYVFGGKRPLSYQEFKRRWRQYALKVGFMKEYFVDENGNELKTLSELRKTPHKKVRESYLTPHQLRHSFATMCFEAGLSPEEAQKFLGHADIRTTVDVYADIRSTKQKVAAEKLNKLAVDIVYYHIDRSQ